MTREQLQERISKKQNDIAKIEKRIAKWSKGLREEDIAICKSFENCIYGTCPRNMHWSEYHGTSEYQEASRNYHAYVDSHKDIPESDDYNKGPNIRELHSAYIDLGEAKNTLTKYQDELANLDKFEGEEKVEVIWNFLMKWKELARSWYRKNCQRYFELKQGYEQAKKEFYAKYDNKPSYYTQRAFEKEYFEYVDSLTKEITHMKGEYVYEDKNNPYTSKWVLTSYTIDEDLLEKKLAKEVKDKYTNLINEITSITGEILDAKGLEIGGKGDINGVVIGKKGKAKVLTFGAGGYAVQCFHYRTKVSKLD